MGRQTLRPEASKLVEVATDRVARSVLGKPSFSAVRDLGYEHLNAQPTDLLATYNGREVVKLADARGHERDREMPAMWQCLSLVHHRTAETVDFVRVRSLLRDVGS